MSLIGPYGGADGHEEEDVEAVDFAILDPVANLFGWRCVVCAPGWYQVGRYDVLWRWGGSWDLSFIAHPENDEVLVFLANERSLEAIATRIVSDTLASTRAMGRLN